MFKFLLCLALPFLDPCGFKMSTFMVKIPLGFLPQMASFFITQGQQDRAHLKCALV
jgi:hypothetical protein